MKHATTISCPICQANSPKTIFSLNCGTMDNSTLYSTVRIKNCSCCGHVFNALSQNELDGLNQYYNLEYAPTNLLGNMPGDLPGSWDLMTEKRFELLYNFMSSHIHKDYEILDIGCGGGSFLDYLRHKGFIHLSGVDMAETYVEYARTKSAHRIELGTAESIPFPDHTCDVLILEQVLEHLFNPAQAFKEARRVLKRGGFLCLGVPDASRYSDFYFFDFYWLLLREHIQHFTEKHIEVLGAKFGFEMLSCRQTTHAIMSNKMIMPNLYVLLRSSGPDNNTIPKNLFDCQYPPPLFHYIEEQKSRQQLRTQMTSKLSQSRIPVFVWGIGREFLYLYESAGLNRCNIAGLIDVNIHKQQTASFKGLKILPCEDILRAAPVDSVLLITAIAHIESIANSARSFGFKGEIIDLTLPSSSLKKS